MAIETDELGPGWDGVQPPQKGGGGKRQSDGVSLFMKLVPREEPYRIRLACTPVRFRKHRWAFRNLKQFPISPASDPSEKDLDIAWREGKFMPPVRYAAFVFDRDFENRVRILEESGDVFGPIGNHAHATKVNAASPTKGWDWLVLVSEVTNSDGKKTRSYAVTIDTSKNGPTPFTEAEIKALENPKFQREELENKYFVKCTPEELKDLWDQLPDAAKKNDKRDSDFGNKDKDGGESKKAQPSNEPPAETVAVKPVVQAATAAQTTTTTAASPAETVKTPAVDVATDDSFLASEPEAPAGDDEVPARLF